MWRVLAPLAGGWLVWAFGLLALPRKGPYSLAVLVMFSVMVGLLTLGVMLSLLAPILFD